MSLVAMMTANLNVMAQETATAKAPMGNNVNRSQASFITDGNWNDGTNWDTGVVPAPGSDVVIMANAVIPAGYTAVADEVSIEGGSITVADGGQLRHNTEGLVVTMKKNIESYDDVDGTDNYYLLAFPFSVDVAVPNAMTANEGCDFYKFNGDFLEAEWRNNKQETITTVSGTTGYLYANSEAIELSLTGSTYPSYNEEVIPVTVPYDEGSTNPYNGWALLGNPFTCNAYIYYHNSDDELVPMEFMVYDATGELMTLSGEPIAPMQGFFVKVTETTTVYIKNYVDHSSHEYVDLGLPSGTLWATCNVGADTPEDYGDYFAWGETQPKDYYDLSSYQYYIVGDHGGLTKYCSDALCGYFEHIDTRTYLYSDCLTTLQPSDDAATANWGSDWRMPTSGEWQELYNNTTCTWTTQNGVNGRLFTAANGNSLFLSAAGYRDGSSLNGAGSKGYYWSSSLDVVDPLDAWLLDFLSDYYGMYSNNRYYGRTVRAIRSQSVSYIINATVNPVEGGEVRGCGTYYEGSIFNLTAIPNEGYIFNGWTENNEMISTRPSYSSSVNRDRNLVANFDSVHEYVDLGLPSRLLWATCNVGADSPEDYGDYFAWGEITPKAFYFWGNYQYSINGLLIKYCENSEFGYNGFTDNLTTLLPEDDAATANWGAVWRTPTKEEWNELYNNTTCIWTTQNGVNGCLFIASNGNSLFLPAAGRRFENHLDYAGDRGRYWSSSQQCFFDGSFGWAFVFDSDNATMNHYHARISGLSVRAVFGGSIFYEIDATAYPEEGGEVYGAGDYQDGAECMLTVTTNEGYIFVNWTENGEVVSTEATYYFMADRDRDLVANFAVSGGNSYNIIATANPEEGGEVYGAGEYQDGAECMLTVTTNEGYIFVNWTENGEVVSTEATYSFSVNRDRNLVANFALSGGNDHSYVDLGLPSGLLWATCNVGADSPEDYGDYFAWGETTPKDTYDWCNYQYCIVGNSIALTKYCRYSSYGYNGYWDVLSTLLPEDDAATANWGAGWRMPTKEEWEELYNNTTCIWTTKNGVKGRLFTASNGNSIFLPAAGYRKYTNLYCSGSLGNYWSSSLINGEPLHFSYMFMFSSVGLGTKKMERSYGQSVRAVYAFYEINATANPEEGGEVSGTGQYHDGAECTLTVTTNEGYTFVNWTENGEVVSNDSTYSFTVNSNRDLVANFTTNYSGYVDLGLPSGLLWATCNVGADTPEAYGDYFAWGETQPKNTYNWSTYQYCIGSSNTSLTKYCNNSSYGYEGFTDSLTTLLPEDDAATANWGSDWRMPTKEEFEELYNNTTVTWTRQNGVYGRRFTAANGNSLFLPAAGYRFDSSLNAAGSRGHYWSSSLGTNNPSSAWNFNFYSGNCSMNGYNRSCGFTVRPVREN